MTALAQADDRMQGQKQADLRRAPLASHARVEIKPRRVLGAATMGRSGGLSPVTSARLVACGAPLFLFHAIAYLFETCAIQRDLDSVELYAGEGMLTRAFRNQAAECKV